MDGFAVTRGNDCMNVLSLFYIEDCSVYKKVTLPLDEDDSVVGVLRCDGLVCIHGHKGKIVLYSKRFDRLVVLPAPTQLLPPNCGSLIVCGLGHDAKSKDYKVIRYYSHLNYYDEGAKGHMSSNVYFEVYSFLSRLWKKIGPPDFQLKKGGLYIKEKGSCYWIAAPPDSESIPICFGISYHVVSFDFTTEKFSHFPLPRFVAETRLPESDDDDVYSIFELVDYRGSIGAIVYSSNEQLSIKIFVYYQVKEIEDLWVPTHDFSFAGLELERPLSFKYDRFLSLEARPSGDCGRSQLMLYDLDTTMMKKLDIYDYPRPMSGRGGFAVMHFDGDDSRGKHCLSLIGSKDISVAGVVELPFDMDEIISVFSSLEYLVISGSNGQIYLYNIGMSRFVGFLPPLAGALAVPRPSFMILKYCGFGYDAKSREYKIICNYSCQCFDESETVNKEHFELFSFKSYSWKSITSPNFLLRKDGVYIGETGSCYWLANIISEDIMSGDDMAAYFGPSFGDSFKDMAYHVISFDFSTESFGHLRLPSTTCGGDSWDQNVHHELVECRCCLGVVVYSIDKLSSIKLFVWKEEKRSWCMLYSVSLPFGVHRPLGLQDNHLLFLEANLIGGRSQLMVYDLDTQTSKKLNIFNYKNWMRGVSYAECIEKRRRNMKGETKNHIPRFFVGKSSQQHLTS